MQIRDRIKELRRVQAAGLRPNPKNWRTHPPAQRDALKGVLAEIGYADALLVRELSDGSLELIDGHLRAETTPDQAVPVLVLDVNDAEAAKLLAVLDPLTDMAVPDAALLTELLAGVKTQNAAVQAMLDDLQSKTATMPEEPAASPEVALRETYQVIVECRDEDQQREVFERLTADGLKCRLRML